MQRALATHERQLLEFLLTVNRSFYGAYVQRWEAQIKTCLVHEVNVPYCLAISHDEIRLPSGGYTTLARELIGIDEGVPLADSTGQRNTQRFCQFFSRVHKLQGLPGPTVQARGDLVQF